MPLNAWISVKSTRLDLIYIYFDSSFKVFLQISTQVWSKISSSNCILPDSSLIFQLQPLSAVSRRNIGAVKALLLSETQKGYLQLRRRLSIMIKRFRWRKHVTRAVSFLLRLSVLLELLIMLGCDGIAPKEDVCVPANEGQ